LNSLPSLRRIEAQPPGILDPVGPVPAQTGFK
jgi:hypothetical protein